MLIHTYQEAFASHGLAGGQVLLTPEDLVDRQRYLNARHTFDWSCSSSARSRSSTRTTRSPPSELRFGDNDRLAALVASMLSAQLLVLLSDVEGLLERAPADGGGAVVPRVDDVAASTGGRSAAPASSAAAAWSPSSTRRASRRSAPRTP